MICDQMIHRLWLSVGTDSIKQQNDIHVHANHMAVLEEPRHFFLKNS